MILLPGYMVQEDFAAGGNPYGTSYTTGHTITAPDKTAMTLARCQGEWLARFAGIIADARNRGIFAVKRPLATSFASR